jgi:hypothetical protein
MVAEHGAKWVNRAAAVSKDELAWQQHVNAAKNSGTWTPSLALMDKQLTRAFQIERDTLQHDQLLEKAQLVGALSPSETALLDHVILISMLDMINEYHGFCGVCS